MLSLKPIELAFRRALLYVLRFLFRKKRPLPADVDFNSCTFLFLRQDLIGDALISTPVLHAFKKRYPGVALDVLMSPKNHFVLANDPTVRNRLVYEKFLPKALSLLQKVRRNRYDFIVDLLDNQSITSTLWCLFGGGRFRVGLSKENDFCYDIAVPLLAKKEFHVADRTANLLSVFNIDPRQEELHIHYQPSSEAERFAEDFWNSFNRDRTPVLGVNISAGASYRMWWRENCRNFIREVIKKFPELRILVLSVPADRLKAEEVTRAVLGTVLAPLTPSFDHAAALIERLSFLATPDTSMCQVAAAFRVPSVVLYPNLAVLHGHLWTPYRSDAENIAASFDDIGTIRSEQIIDAFKRLAERHPQRIKNIVGMPQG